MNTKTKIERDLLPWFILVCCGMLIVLAMTGCTMLDKIEKTVDALKETSGLIRNTMASIDTNKDQKYSPQEGIDWVTGGGLAGLVAALGAIYVRWKGSSTKAAIHGRIDKLADKIDTAGKS
jgi:hypothetical protein